MKNRRKLNRVAFERGHAVQTFTIHGTWRRACTMHDVPETGTRLSIDDSIQDSSPMEFFLTLSSTGVAFPPLRVAWSTATNSTTTS